MATHHIGNFKHLTLSDRAEIEIMIEKGFSFLKWPGLFPKTPLPSLKKSGGIVSLFHTIGTRTAADARNALIFSFLYQAAPVRTHFLSLPFAPNAAASAVLFYCPDFSPLICPRLLKPPYVCNSCPKLRTCSHDFYFYRAKLRRRFLSGGQIFFQIRDQSVSGIPGKTGQAHLSSFEARAASVPYLSHPQGGDQLFPADSYNYIDLRCFSAVNLDLPRKVSYKPRKNRRSEPEIPGYRMGRTYLDLSST